MRSLLSFAALGLVADASLTGHFVDNVATNKLAKLVQKRSNRAQLDQRHDSQSTSSARSTLLSSTTQTETGNSVGSGINLVFPPGWPTLHHGEPL